LASLPSRIARKIERRASSRGGDVFHAICCTLASSSRHVLEPNLLADGRANDRAHLRVAQGLRAGDGERLADIFRPGKRLHRDIGNVGGMNERNSALARGGAEHPFVLDGVGPVERVRHKSGRLHEGEGNAFIAYGGLARGMPDGGADILLARIIGGKLDEPLHSRRLRGLCCKRIQRRNIRLGIYKENNIDIRRGYRQTREIRQISNMNFRVIAIA